MKTTIGQSNFTRGEVSPLLQGRTEEDVYKSSVLEALNCIILPHGPLSRRTGTEFIAEVKNSSYRARLIRYRLTSNYSYIIEFGETYARFYTQRGQVLSGGVPLELVTPFTAVEAQDMQVAQFGLDLYISHPSHTPQVLTRSAAGVWSISALRLHPEPTYESGLINWASSVTPGATSGTGITFTFSAATLLASDVGRQIVNLSGSGRGAITAVGSSTSCTVSIVENFPSTSAITSGNWKLDLSPLTTLTPSGTALGSIISLTAAAAAFRSTDVGTYVLMNDGVAKIITVTSSTVAQAEVQKSLSTSTAATVFTFELPTWGGSRGYPTAISFFEQRLFLGGTGAQPVTIWGSASGDPSDFGVGSKDADALEFDLNSGAGISWMAANRELIIGGDSIEVSVSSGQNSPITPSTALQRSRTPHGANPHQPIQLPNEVVFIQKSLTKLRTLLYDYGVDSYNAEDISLISEHIFSAGVTQLGYVQNPYPIIYSVLSTGDMAATTYMRSPQVLGTSLITTDGTIENVASVQNGGVDDVYIVVRRNINGTYKRFVEIFSHGDGSLPIDIFSDSCSYYSLPLTITNITNANPGVVTSAAHGLSNGDTVLIKNVEGMTEVNDMIFTVAGVTTNTFQLSGVDTTLYNVYTSSGEVHKRVLTISGLAHLEGKTVQVKCDGATHPDCTVSSGSITLQFPSAEVTVGLPYNTSITTLPAEFNSGQGTTMYSQRSRWPRPVLKVYQSTVPNLNGQYLPARNTNDAMDNAVPLYTGNLEYGPTVWGNTGQLNIATNRPYPLNLIGIFGSIEGGVK
jgi:hypothetical protein